LTFPSETWASWSSFLATATQALPVIGNNNDGSNGGGDGNDDNAGHGLKSSMGLSVVLAVSLGWLMVWVR